MNWGSVADWVVIGGTVAVFGVGQVVAYAMLRRDMQTMKTAHSKVASEIINIKGREVAISTLAACLDKATKNSGDIEALRKVAVTTSDFETARSGCRSELINLIRDNAREMEGMRSDIREIKDTSKEHAQHASSIAVAIAQLATRLEERTAKGEQA